MKITNGPADIASFNLELLELQIKLNADSNGLPYKVNWVYIFYKFSPYITPVCLKWSSDVTSY